jgi:hypothetical protein
MQVQRQPGIPFILVTVFLDTLAFGFVITYPARAGCDNDTR